MSRNVKAVLKIPQIQVFLKTKTALILMREILSKSLKNNFKGEKREKFQWTFFGKGLFAAIIYIVQTERISWNLDGSGKKCVQRNADTDNKINLTYLKPLDTYSVDQGRSHCPGPRSDRECHVNSSLFLCKFDIPVEF